jgi:hypothetical protein
MAKAFDSWQVHPHGPIEELDDRVWRVEAKLPNMDLMRVMTLAKRQDGKVVIHNAIALDDDEMKRIEAWGEPAFLVVPNGYHRLDAPAFSKRYPDAKVVCPAGARKKVEEVVKVDLTYEEWPSDDAVQIETLDGTGEQEGVMIIRSEDGATLVFNDAIFNAPHGKGLTGFIFKHVTQSTGGPRVSRVFRWFVMKDRGPFRAHLERLAKTSDLRRIIVSHYRTIDEDAAETLRGVAAAL